MSYNDIMIYNSANKTSALEVTLSTYEKNQYNKHVQQCKVRLFAFSARQNLAFYTKPITLYRMLLDVIKGTTNQKDLNLFMKGNFQGQEKTRKFSLSPYEGGATIFMEEESADGKKSDKFFLTKSTLTELFWSMHFALPGFFKTCVIDASVKETPNETSPSNFNPGEPPKETSPSNFNPGEPPF